MVVLCDGGGGVSVDVGQRLGAKSEDQIVDNVAGWASGTT